LVAAACLMLVTVMFVRLAGLFSLALILLYLYSTIMTVFVYTEYLPEGLRQKERLARTEEMNWKDKI